MESGNPSFSSFTSLPIEIRDQIYSLLLTKHYHMNRQGLDNRSLLEDYDHRPSDPFPGILLTSKQIHAEAIANLLRTSAAVYNIVPGQLYIPHNTIPLYMQHITLEVSFSRDSNDGVRETYYAKSILAQLSNLDIPRKYLLLHAYHCYNMTLFQLGIALAIGQVKNFDSVTVETVAEDAGIGYPGRGL
ncbi:hypothetical protein MMC21_004841 [Puttea exsequens]|nr:hypothetical protein [Puttea exsequens]